MPDRSFAGDAAQPAHHIMAGHAGWLVHCQKPIHLSNLAFAKGLANLTIAGSI
jgi:hypothetical protein